LKEENYKEHYKVNTNKLIDFIKNKFHTSPNDIVEKDQGKDLTLKDLLLKMMKSVHPDEMSIDFLDVLTDNSKFHRMDKFYKQNEKIGGGHKLRSVFLSPEGKYFSELCLQEFSKHQDSHSVNEMSVSLFGKKLYQWNSFSKWVVDNNIYSKKC